MNPSIDKAEAVVIGVSAGAIDALTRILKLLPSAYPLPVFVVVHLPADTKSILPELFSPAARIPIKEAEDKEPVKPGTVYFAPPNYHLLIDHGMLALSSDEPELFSRPSINVLFESAADAYGEGLVGVVLTGGNNDGADGLRKIVELGGRAVVQDPADAEIRFMPEAALAACPDAQKLNLDEIGALLARLTRYD